MNIIHCAPCSTAAPAGHPTGQPRLRRTPQGKRLSGVPAEPGERLNWMVMAGCTARTRSRRSAAVVELVDVDHQPAHSHPSGISSCDEDYEYTLHSARGFLARHRSSQAEQDHVGHPRTPLNMRLSSCSTGGRIGVPYTRCRQGPQTVPAVRRAIPGRRQRPAQVASTASPCASRRPLGEPCPRAGTHGGMRAPSAMHTRLTAGSCTNENQYRHRASEGAPHLLGAVLAAWVGRSSPLGRWCAAVP
ncbi:hypothetical protein FHS40_008092 [Streptomyces spectabilis]|uniref:Uncharacterized protein n=1 Tax=Streptomyces spectabilis TaxID=68270 RepID=A0A7W8B3E7_STRST|nr:hypothetical protein [Streptomyces spectabilis]